MPNPPLAVMPKVLPKPAIKRLKLPALASRNGDQDQMVGETELARVTIHAR